MVNKIFQNRLKIKNEKMKKIATDSLISKISLITMIGLLLSTFVMAQRPAQGPVSDKIVTPEKLGYELIWQDEFEGSTLDTTKWRVRGIGQRAIAYVSEKAVIKPTAVFKQAITMIKAKIIVPKVPK